MVFQGISPMFWGTLSDTIGRRHIFIMCLLVLSLSCVGLALTPTSDYWLLLFLRCFQAAGSASTIALAAGITGDIATRAERGGFYGFVSIGPMIGPAIGPVLGGVLAEKLGWRAVFWFLCIVSAVCMIVMILFLPETLRTIVGNGSIRPMRIYLPVFPIIGPKVTEMDADMSTAADAPLRISRSFQNPLRLILHVDIALLLLICAVIYAVFYGVTASISTVFHQAYPSLNEIELGLCFLSVGGGMTFGSLFAGKILDWDFQRVRRRLLNGADDRDFPIERARLRLLPAFIVVFAACCVAYGWCIDRKTSIAAPLVFLIGVGFSSIAVMGMIQTLLIDLLPLQGSAITACNNLVRCAFGAAVVSSIQPLLDALGTGWGYVLLGGISVLMAPAVYLVVWIGPRCRARRAQTAEERKEAQA